jgi:hypothetical protein
VIGTDSLQAQRVKVSMGIGNSVIRMDSTKAQRGRIIKADMTFAIRTDSIAAPADAVGNAAIPFVPPKIKFRSNNTRATQMDDPTARSDLDGHRRLAAQTLK